MVGTGDVAFVDWNRHHYDVALGDVWPGAASALGVSIVGGWNTLAVWVDSGEYGVVDTYAATGCESQGQGYTVGGLSSASSMEYYGPAESIEGSSASEPHAVEEGDGAFVELI